MTDTPNPTEADTSRPTNYTDPTTIDVGEVIANITHDYRMRGHTWTDRLSWPNVTVMALAAEVRRLSTRADTAEAIVRRVREAWEDLASNLGEIALEGHSYRISKLDAAFTVPSPDTTTEADDVAKN